MWYAGLGQVKLLRGELDEAAHHIEAAADLAEASGAHFWSAEIGRLEGLISLAQDPHVGPRRGALP